MHGSTQIQVCNAFFSRATGLKEFAIEGNPETFNWPWEDCVRDLKLPNTLERITLKGIALARDWTFISSLPTSTHTIAFIRPWLFYLDTVWEVVSKFLVKSHLKQIAFYQMWDAPASQYALIDTVKDYMPFGGKDDWEMFPYPDDDDATGEMMARIRLGKEIQLNGVYKGDDVHAFLLSIVPRMIPMALTSKQM